MVKVNLSNMENTPTVGVVKIILHTFVEDTFAFTCLFVCCAFYVKISYFNLLMKFVCS